MTKQTISAGIGALAGFGVCWLVFGLSGCSRGGDVIAVVNGEPITKDEYYKYLEFKPDVRVQTASGVAALPTEGTLGFQGLQDLIGQKVTMQLARDKKVYPSDAEVNQEMEFKRKVDPNFLTKLTARGLTLDMIRQSLTLDLIKEKLTTQGITVTTAEAEKYIKDNANDFIEEERDDLSWVLVQDKPTQKRVDEELNAGQSFTQVALRYSAAQDKNQTGGKLIDRGTGGAPKLSMIPVKVQEQIKKLKDGETTEWITLVDGSAKFLLNKRIKAHPMVMDDPKKEMLRRLMAQKKGSEARDINRQVLKKLKDSKVDVRRQDFKAPWEEAYKKFMMDNKLESITGARSSEGQ